MRGRPCPNGLILASDGSFYGTTYYAANPGTYDLGSGTVFKITPSGAFTTVYSFCSQSGCADGANPAAGLIQAADGDFYGTTLFGGGNNAGTAFKITPAGTLTTLYSFCSQSGCADGEEPEAGLVQAANGNLYGTAFDPAFGTVFEITPGGTFTTLVNLPSDGADGGNPAAGLVQGPGGYLYGTTTNSLGGVFKMTPSGTLTPLYTFCTQSGCTDGEGPAGALVPATDGNLYGTTSGGGGTNCRGTVFAITPSGTLTTLYNFCSGSHSTDGVEPSGLLQATSGDFYGVTYHGGAHNDGTVYSLSVGLGPFVKTVPHNGQIGQVIRILGNGLTGATAVTFNGTPAAFTIVAATEIRTTVPTGATTGKIQVTTPAGMLLSAGPFAVLP